MTTDRLTQLPSGSWRIRWTEVGGRRRAAVYATKPVALEALRSRLIERDRARAGLEPAPSGDTIAAVAERWLERREPDPRMEPSRRRRRERRVADNRAHLERHIVPALGRLRPRDVTWEVLEAFVLRLEGTRSSRPGEDNAGGKVLAAATVRNVVNTLRKMLRDAGHPVAVTVRLPRTAPGWIRDAADVGRFLDRCHPPWFRVAAALAVYPGLRRGEVTAVRWKRFDFRRGVIAVSESWDTDTKDREARWVPMAPELKAILLDWRKRRGGSPDDRVVPFSRGSKVAAWTRRACLAAGLEPVTFQGLRHTAASHLAERLPLPAVQAILGHGSITTTSRYAHASPWSAARDPRARLSFRAARGARSRNGHAGKRGRRKRPSRRRGKGGATRI